MERNVWIGAASTVISTVAFGTTYVPTRYFETGDGMYFQFMMSAGQLFFSFFVLALNGFPPIYPIPMIGGVVYSIGNALTPFIMNEIGMAIGSLLWNNACCVSGWAVPRFGLFGTEKTVPSMNFVNIVGVVIVCLSSILFVPIRYYRQKVRPAPWTLEKLYRPRFSLDSGEAQKPIPETVEPEPEPEIKPQFFTKRKMIVVLLTLVPGTLIGNNMTAVNYQVHHMPVEEQPRDLSVFFFSYCLGAMITSTIIFTAYCIFKKNRPAINPEITIPCLSAGVLYGIAMVFFFLANQHLDQVVAYPIISHSPGLVMCLWSILVFKEIRGKFDIALLVSGFVATLAGIVILSISR